MDGGFISHGNITSSTRAIATTTSLNNQPSPSQILSQKPTSPSKKPNSPSKKPNSPSKKPNSPSYKSTHLSDPDEKSISAVLVKAAQGEEDSSMDDLLEL